MNLLFGSLKEGFRVETQALYLIFYSPDKYFYGFKVNFLTKILKVYVCTLFCFIFFNPSFKRNIYLK